MKRTPMPFATPLGAAAAVVALGAVALAWWWSGGGVASPGPLGRGGDGERHGGVARHADLGCGACHGGLGGGTTSTRCLACHDDIGAQIAVHEPLHGRLPDTSRCLGCHTEHRGADAELTRIDRGTFPHDATGYSLEVHQEKQDETPFGCDDCHGDDVLRFDARRCSDCHGGDAHDFLPRHVEAFGDDCLACHDGVDRFADGRFDHDKTDYPLTGKHAKTRCEECHRGARDVDGFDRAPGRCVDCHRDDDVHRGDEGDDCGACHTTTAWKPAKRRAGDDGATSPPPTTRPPTTRPPTTRPPTTRPPVAKPPVTTPPVTRPPPEEAPADHVFPLDHGGGGEVACKTCHPNGNRTYTCFGCHHHTPANVERIHAPRGIDDTSDCAGCHPTGGRARRR